MVTTALARRIDRGGGDGSALNSGSRAGENDGVGGAAPAGAASNGVAGDEGLFSRVVFGDDQRQPWKVVQTWLELRHDLAVVALLQVRIR